jgi:CDP-paratose 2-epimerase
VFHPGFNDYALITGGAGFIGTNLAERLVREGGSVVVLDNFSRSGVEQNARYLAELAPSRLAIVRGDCRDQELVRELARGASQIFHFAAQVAVTTSLVDPERDFDVNLRGTLTVLEAVRRLERRPSLVFTSTNKVYGALGDLELRVVGRRYQPVDDIRGIDEQRPLDFHSPYGCSKGAADQYVLDYARSYGLPAAVFRMSCIYGPHQCGNEDQGWVAHFLMRALAGHPITIYGDGRQVRDVLYVGDLVEAFLRARDRMDLVAGQAFNLGGGEDNALSLLDLLDRIAALSGQRPELRFAEARTGDQRYFVTDTAKARRVLDWAPLVGVDEGIRRLAAWLGQASHRAREYGPGNAPRAHAAAPRIS